LLHQELQQFSPIKSTGHAMQWMLIKWLINPQGATFLACHTSQTSNKSGTTQPLPIQNPFKVSKM